MCLFFLLFNLKYSSNAIALSLFDDEAWFFAFRLSQLEFLIVKQNNSCPFRFLIQYSQSPIY